MQKNVGPKTSSKLFQVSSRSDFGKGEEVCKTLEMGWFGFGSAFEPISRWVARCLLCVWVFLGILARGQACF